MLAGEAERQARAECASGRNVHRWATAALILVGFSLRIYRIQVQSIWWDEGISVYLARLEPLAILSARAGSQHPPLYYLALQLWSGLTGVSEFSVRFLSLLSGVLLIPAVYRVMGHLFDPPTALVGAVLVALNPAYVVYAQEARVYITLPLVYLFMLWKVHLLVRGEFQSRDWWGLALLESLSLYLHYFSVFSVLYLNCVIAVIWWRRRQAVNLRRWIWSQVLVFGSMLPWMAAVATRWGEAGAKLGYRQLTVQSVDLAQFWRSVWHFFNGGKIELIGSHAVFTTLSGIMALLSLACVYVAFRRDEKKRENSLLLAHCIIPLTMSYAAWWWRPGSHPRYVLMYGLPIMLLLGRSIWILWAVKGWRRLLSLLLGSMVLAVYAAGLSSAYLDPQYFKDNVRSVGWALQAEAGAEDAVIVDWNDHAVEYYYSGPAPILMIPRGDVSAAVEYLTPRIAGRRRVFLVHNYKSIRGLQGFVPGFLELNATLVSVRDFQGYNVRRYDQVSPIVVSPEIVPASEDLGAMRLTGAYVQRQVFSDDAVSVALRCMAVESPLPEYAAALRLVDGSGHTAGQTDLILLNGRSQTTSLWKAGEEAVTYGVIPVPPGTPSGPYGVLVRFYERETLRGLDRLDASGAPVGQTWTLAGVDVAPGDLAGRDAYRALKALNLTPVQGIRTPDGLVLESYRGAGKHVVPGQKYQITLLWRSLVDGLPDYDALVLVSQGDVILGEDASALGGAAYPTSDWRSGETMLDRRDLAVSVRAQDGEAALELQIGNLAFTLDDLEVRGAEHVFLTPSVQHQVGIVLGGVAELVGYDLEAGAVTAAEPVPLILYWRAVSDEPSPVAYTVFTHLLDGGGRLIGQHDGPPDSGRRPTTGWVKGEIIVDRHEMVFRDVAYSGKASIEVGLYDPSTLDRLATSAGTDRVLLPSAVEVRATSR